MISQLESDGTIVPVLDTRTARGMQDVYGGAYAAGCIYVPVEFAKKYPNTAQAIVNAMVRALRFIQQSTPDQIVAAVPSGLLHRQGGCTRWRWKRTSKRISMTARSASTRRAGGLSRPEELRPAGADGDGRRRQELQHDVPAEGRAEVPLMNLTAAARMTAAAVPALAFDHVTCAFAGDERRRALHCGERRIARGCAPANSFRSSGRPVAANPRC